MSMHRGFTVAGQLARRSLAVCAISSLIASTALTPLSAAFAQSQQAPATQPASPGPPITAQNQAGDPPARVGRISKINGTVSFHTADEDQWGPVTLNYPLTNGNALWTEPGARAELQLGSANRLVMDSNTELNVATLDDSAFEANLPQGSAYVSLQDVAPGESYTIRTPRGSVQLSQPGRYAITAGDDDTPTTVSALAGAPAQLTDRGLTQSVPAGQTATLNGPVDGDDPVKVAVAPGQPSAFAQSAMAEERQAQAAAPPPAPNAAAAPAPSTGSAPVPVPAAMPVQVQGMTGAQDLAAYGTWSSAPQYGSVWYPPVQAGWVPYRHGHWAWVHPWGWTWVADEPWGFAPFHYGRWVMVHDRWAWSPGFHPHHHHPKRGHWPRPVYAPALVAFFGSGSGVSISVSIGRDVGWVPLGWHEPYYPPYRVSRNYIRNVNVTHITNITKVTNVTVNNTTVNRYVNRNSATFVQADTMRHSRPVSQAVQRVDDRQMQSMRAERRPQVQPDRQRQIEAAPGPRIDQAALRRPDQARPEQGRNAQRPGSQNDGSQREMSRRQDQPQMMRQDQMRQQEQRQEQRQARPQERQRQDMQRPDRQPQQVQREQAQREQPQREQQRQAQPQERQRLDTQRQDQQRQMQGEQQRQMQQQDRQRQEVQRQDQQRQQMQRDQQVQQQRQQQEMQRQQGQQREQQVRQQADQQRQQEAQNQRQQQEQRQQQRRRDADL